MAAGTRVPGQHDWIVEEEYDQKLPNGTLEKWLRCPCREAHVADRASRRASSLGTIPDLRGPPITFVLSVTFGNGYAYRRSCGD